LDEEAAMTENEIEKALRKLSRTYDIASNRQDEVRELCRLAAKAIRRLRVELILTRDRDTNGSS
jgi:hypothetical protein